MPLCYGCEQDVDTVRYYPCKDKLFRVGNKPMVEPLCDACAPKCEVYGCGKPQEPGKDYCAEHEVEAAQEEGE